MTTLVYLFVLFIVLGIAIAAYFMPLSDNQDDDDEHTPSPKPKTDEKKPSVFKTEKTLSEKKGAVGEQIIKVMALSQLDRQKYIHFNNLIIPSQDKTTQIDNIIVSPFGIFVLEAKYFSGWIYGQAKQVNWTHTLSRHSKFQFKNPLRQNYKHIKALSSLLRLPESHFHSVVVFTHRDCQLKTDLPKNVCLIRDLFNYIDEFKTEILTEPQIQTVCQILSQEQWQATPERLAAHIKQFQTE
ncbi:nuclease-related domain-containing protein [Alysiella crassa]|uniref:Nuclease-related domain n=1 Tax=Alysiella crassa TaxID=153491 RepID=A0A376BNJ0_9NEIS|nr:nuclease-related domain-containing protein [Alysiella crassa]UOP06658.1 NERD domain-containing protein [Alysiella crassa]SSY71240.1 Nuclease-related domain [Alysiella crassa]